MRIREEESAGCYELPLAEASDIAVKPYNNDIYPLLVTACAGQG